MDVLAWENGRKPYEWIHVVECFDKNELQGSDTCIMFHGVHVVGTFNLSKKTNPYKNKKLLFNWEELSATNLINGTVRRSNLMCRKVEGIEILFKERDWWQRLGIQVNKECVCVCVLYHKYVLKKYLNVLMFLKYIKMYFIISCNGSWTRMFQV